MRQDIKQGITYFYFAQLMIVALSAIGFRLTIDIQASVSSVLGGLVCLLPGFLFAINYFKYEGAQQAKKILSAFYLGEAIKLVFTGVLFAAVFITYTVNATAFFTTFISVQAMYWFAPCLIVKNN